MSFTVSQEEKKKKTLLEFPSVNIFPQADDFYKSGVCVATDIKQLSKFCLCKELGVPISATKTLQGIVGCGLA